MFFQPNRGMSQLINSCLWHFSPSSTVNRLKLRLVLYQVISTSHKNQASYRTPQTNRKKTWWFFFHIISLKTTTPFSKAAFSKNPSKNQSLNFPPQKMEIRYKLVICWCGYPVILRILGVLNLSSSFRKMSTSSLAPYEITPPNI